MSVQEKEALSIFFTEMCCFFEQPDGNLNTDSQSLKVQCVGFKLASSDEVAYYKQLNSPPLKSPGEHIVDAKNVKNKGLLKSRWVFFVCLFGLVHSGLL